MREDERASDDDRGLAGVEGWLREELEPDRSTVERVVRRSLAAGVPARPRRWLAFGMAGSAAVILVAMIVMFLARDESRAPRARTARGENAVEILTITNVSGEIEVFFPADRSGDGPLPVVRAPRKSEHVTIFNSNGVVAAFAPAPVPRHFLMGGKS